MKIGVNLGSKLGSKRGQSVFLYGGQKKAKRKALENQLAQPT